MSCQRPNYNIMFWALHLCLLVQIIVWMACEIIAELVKQNIKIFPEDTAIFLADIFDLTSAMDICETTDIFYDVRCQLRKNTNHKLVNCMKKIS